MSELGRRFSKVPFRIDDHIRALATGLKYLGRPRITPVSYTHLTLPTTPYV